MSFISTLKTLAIGETFAKSKLVEGSIDTLTLAEIHSNVRKLSANVTGSISRAGMNGQFITTADHKVLIGSGLVIVYCVGVRVK